MVRALAQTVRGEGSSPSQSYILFTNVTLVVSKKILYIIYNIKPYLSDRLSPSNQDGFIRYVGKYSL